MLNQPSPFHRSWIGTALAALIGLLLLTGLSPQGAASSEPLPPLVDDGGPGGIATGEPKEVSGHRQSVEASQADATALGKHSKAMLPIARTESMQNRSALSSSSSGKHADDEAYCFFCFSYR